MNESVALLERWRLRLDLSIPELWWRYFALGGMRLERDLEAILRGTLEPTTADWDLLAVALNERAFELGAGHPVPYSTDGDPS